MTLEMKSVFAIICSLLRFWPHIIVYMRCSCRETLDYEMARWYETHHIPARKGVRGLLYLLAALPEYRSLFYFRTGRKWLSRLAKGQNNLEFYTEPEKIGRGLVIWHGFSTVINVQSMGEDCQVWQNVVIGKSSSDEGEDRPIIGNGVRIAAGAIVVGDIRIADNSTIGAGAIAVKDVTEEGTLVVAQPSRYISRKR